MLRRGPRDHQRSACSLNLIEGYTRASRNTNIKERWAELKCSGLSDGSRRLILVKSSILTKCVAPRAKRPPVVRVLVESRQGVH
jgi:hypothetical protein